MKNSLLPLIIFLILVACATASDKVYVLDPPGGDHALRAHDPKEDRPLTDCNPEMLPSGELEYKCVVHFIPDYKALLIQISTLEEQLKACQNGTPQPAH